MKRVFVCFLASSTMLLMTFSSCQKAQHVVEAPKKNSDPVVNENNNKTEVFWYVVVAAIAVVAIVGTLAEGQSHTTTTTTTDAHGNTTTTTQTTCSGVGTCKMSMRTASNGPTLSGNEQFNVSPDYQLNMRLIRNSDGKLLLGVGQGQNPTGLVNRFFYGDQIQFLSPGQQYVINNQGVLNQLGVSAPIVINAGMYHCYNGSDGGTYIAVGQL